MSSPEVNVLVAKLDEIAVALERIADALDDVAGIGRLRVEVITPREDRP